MTETAALPVPTGPQVSNFARRIDARWSMLLQSGGPDRIGGAARAARAPSHASVVLVLGEDARRSTEVTVRGRARDQPVSDRGITRVGVHRDERAPRRS